MLLHFFNCSFRAYSIDQIYLKAFQHSRCCENPMKLLRCSNFCKISQYHFSRWLFLKEIHRRSLTGFSICLWYCLVMLFGMLIGCRDKIFRLDKPFICLLYIKEEWIGKKSIIQYLRYNISKNIYIIHSNTESFQAYLQ